MTLKQIIRSDLWFILGIGIIIVVSIIWDIYQMFGCIIYYQDNPSLIGHYVIQILWIILIFIYWFLVLVFYYLAFLILIVKHFKLFRVVTSSQVSYTIAALFAILTTGYTLVLIYHTGYIRNSFLLFTPVSSHVLRLFFIKMYLRIIAMFSVVEGLLGHTLSEMNGGIFYAIFISIAAFDLFIMLTWQKLDLIAYKYGENTKYQLW